MLNEHGEYIPNFNKEKVLEDARVLAKKYTEEQIKKENQEKEAKILRKRNKELAQLAALKKKYES